EFFGEILKTNDTSTVDEWYSYLNNFDISLITNYTTKNNSTTKEINNIQVIGYEQSKLYGEVQISSVPKNKFIDALWNYILIKYDFDVCMNIYYIENGVDKVRIGHLDSIRNKIINVGNVN